MIVGTNRVAAFLSAVFMVIAAPVSAQEATGLTMSSQTASVTYGPYGRFALGFAANTYDNAHWQNGAGDPVINFNFGDENGGFGEVAVGFDWQNGFRGELAFARFGDTDAVGPCASASNGSACNTHANITGGSISSTTIMGNVYYAPMEFSGNNSVFQPFLTAGLGLSMNDVSEWTRTANPGNPTLRRTRSFSSNTETSFAWSLGLGAAWQVTRPGQHPVIVEMSYRYFDLGEAQGGAAPLPGSGAGTPVTPLTYDNTRQVISLGVRIPLQRL